MDKCENKDICSKCGGYCCKKSGCDYLPSDFDNLSYNSTLEILSSGNISIVAALEFSELKDGKLVVVPFLYLRARNKDRDVVDLLSIKNTCSMLTKDGCSYDINNRPSGGALLIPMENGRCYREAIDMSIWDNYQKVLSRVVKRYTGMSVDQKLKEDIENLFYDVLAGKLEGVAKEEVEDIKGLIPLLLRTNIEEYKKANKRYKGNTLVK